MEKITKEIDKHGTIVYRNENNEFHNINDKPAIIYNNDSKRWFKNGLRHRTKGPAAITSLGLTYWFYNGNNITDKAKQLMEEGRLNSDWRNWTEEDEFLFILLVS